METKKTTHKPATECLKKSPYFCIAMWSRSHGMISLASDPSIGGYYLSQRKEIKWHGKRLDSFYFCDPTPHGESSFLEIISMLSIRPIGCSSSSSCCCFLLCLSHKKPLPLLLLGWRKNSKYFRGSRWIWYEDRERNLLDSIIDSKIWSHFWFQMSRRVPSPMTDDNS